MALLGQKLTLLVELILLLKLNFLRVAVFEIHVHLELLSSYLLLLSNLKLLVNLLS